MVSYRNCCIRATCTNNTKEGIYTYDMEKIGSIVTSWASVDEYEYMLHNQGKDAEQPHIHIVLRLKSPVAKENIISKFPYCNIEGIKSNYSKCVQYLVHVNDADKVQYLRESIQTNLKSLDKYFLKSGKEADAEVENLLSKINDGEIREYNITQHCDILLYAKYKTMINNAFEYYAKKLEHNKCRDLDVLFFQGSSGTGKTTYAKMICDKLGLSYCVSSSSNDPMQDYKGEDVLILDDLRDYVFEFDDLLKILDNNTKSSMKSRYRNKMFLGSKIIITSTIEIKDWYSFNKYEEKIQLYRRCSQMLKFKKNTIDIFEFDILDNKYISVTKDIVNPIYKMYVKKSNLKAQGTLGIMLELEEKSIDK